MDLDALADNASKWHFKTTCLSLLPLPMLNNVPTLAALFYSRYGVR